MHHFILIIIGFGLAALCAELLLLGETEFGFLATTLAGVGGPVGTTEQAAEKVAIAHMAPAKAGSGGRK